MCLFWFFFQSLLLWSIPLRFLFFCSFCLLLTETFGSYSINVLEVYLDISFISKFLNFGPHDAFGRIDAFRINSDENLVLRLCVYSASIHRRNARLNPRWPISLYNRFHAPELQEALHCLLWSWFRRQTRGCYSCCHLPRSSSSNSSSCFQWHPSCCFTIEW